VGPFDFCWHFVAVLFLSSTLETKAAKDEVKVVAGSAEMIDFNFLGQTYAC